MSTAVDFLGLWHNELDSEMEIQTVDANRQVKGRYRSKVGAVSYSQWFDLIGVAIDDQISFFVNWIVGVNSITAWVGQVNLDKQSQERISTMWLLTSDIERSKGAGRFMGLHINRCRCFLSGTGTSIGSASYGSFDQRDSETKNSADVRISSTWLGRREIEKAPSRKYS